MWNTEESGESMHGVFQLGTFLQNWRIFVVENLLYKRGRLSIPVFRETGSLEKIVSCTDQPIFTSNMQPP
jgi:hypothetical protein